MSGVHGRGLLLMGAAASVVVAALLLAIAFGGLGPGSIDHRLAAAAHRLVLHHRWVRDAAHDLTHLGDPAVVDVGAVVAAAGLVLGGRHRDALLVVLARVATTLLDSALKWAVHRPRPTFATAVAHASGYSFPSGHASGAASFYLPLALLVSAGLARRWALAAATVLVGVVGVTRVLLGVHYPADVIGGAALGVAVSSVGAVWAGAGREPRGETSPAGLARSVRP